jgi:acetylornithine deacetylase/succinyl-diaminopimelate desuccinylase-like protein
MKSAVAAMLAALLRGAAERLEPAGDVIFCATVDEEAGSVAGARYLVERHAELFEGVRYAVSEAGFPAYFGGRRIHLVQVAEKQVCRLRATVRGSGSHGALAAGRDGLMTRLANTLERLEREHLPLHLTPAARLTLESLARAVPRPARPALHALLRPPTAGPALRVLGERGRRLGLLLRNTATATSVRGGESLNVTPSRIELDLDGRLLPGFSPDVLTEELAGLLGPDVELELIFHDPGPTGIDMGGFPLLEEIIREGDPQAGVVPFLLPACTDARFFARLGIQTYGFPPLRLPPDFDFLPTIHGPDERVTAEAVEFATRCLHELLRRFR